MCPLLRTAGILARSWQESYDVPRQEDAGKRPENATMQFALPRCNRLRPRSELTAGRRESEV